MVWVTAGWDAGRIRNAVIFIIVQKSVHHGGGVELRTQYFDFGQLFSVPSTLSGTKDLSGIAMMEETELIYTYYHCSRKIFPKYRDNHGKPLSTEGAVAAACEGSPCGPVLLSRS